MILQQIYFNRICRPRLGLIVRIFALGFQNEEDLIGRQGRQTRLESGRDARI